MSIFNRSKNDSLLSLTTENDNLAITSIIGNGLTFKGDLTFSGKLRLDGKIEGNLKGEYLIIGESGIINGDIDIETCICQGKVKGNIKARDLNVTRGCYIDGNVQTVNLSVESGASLNGKVKVDTKDLRLVKNLTPQEDIAKDLKVSTKVKTKASVG